MQYICIVIIIVLDQIVKAFVDSSMEVGQSVQVWGDFFKITYVQNTGAAFSFMEGHPGLLSFVTGIVLAALLGYIAVKGKSYDRFLTVSLAFIIAGGVGNLIDRVLRGFVVDMFDFGFWPVFNIADIAICLGCAMLVVYMLFIEPKKKKKE